MLSNCLKNTFRNTKILNALKTNGIRDGTQIQEMKTYKKHKKKPPLPSSPRKMNRFWVPEIRTRERGHFKLMSYNILAQDLLVAHPHLYLGNESKYLRWEHRLCRLKEEILDLAPDILCLQEMQFKHIGNLVRHIKGARKLEYIFKKTGHRTDGCAIIYDKEKFRLLEERSVEYYKDGDYLLSRQNIALLAKFEARADPAKKFIVATTHLLFNPRRDDVRAKQIETLLFWLRAFSIDSSNSCAGSNALARKLPVLLTGDFNSTRGTLPYLQLTSCTSTTINNINPGESPSIDDTLQMIELKWHDDAATTFQGDWIMVDYILLSLPNHARGKIRILHQYKLPTAFECYKFLGPIPNKNYGSDHLSVAIVFTLE